MFKDEDKNDVPINVDPFVYDYSPRRSLSDIDWTENVNKKFWTNIVFEIIFVINYLFTNFYTTFKIERVNKQLSYWLIRYNRLKILN